MKQRGGDSGVAPVGRNDGFRQIPHQAHGTSSRAESGNRVVAIEIFTDPVAERPGIFAKQQIQSRHVIGRQRLFVSREGLADFRNDIRQIDFYRHFQKPLGRGALTMPACSRV